MQTNTKHSSYIAGVGAYVPEQVVTSRDIDFRLNGLSYLNVGRMIETITGVKERRYCPDDMQSSDLAVKAALEAIKDANLTVNDIDTILFTSCSRDLGEPATASLIQSKLGAINAARVFDVANACNSFISGLEVMNSMISTGLSKVGLIVSGEKLSSFVNYHLKDPSELKKGFAALTLGDAGGAMVLLPSNGDEKRGIVASSFYADGREWKLSVVMGGGTISPRNAPDSYFTCDSLKLSTLALKHLPTVINKTLATAGINVDEIDLVIPHQVAYSIVEKLSKKYDYPIGRIMVTLDRYGNLGAASVPVALKEAIGQGKAGKGSKVLFLVGAAGFSASAMLVNL
jgi:3-oxoacyl-(acyl-carrier-protein) synthase III